MYRSHTCGELRLADAGKKVTLSGWVARTRDKGAMMFIDLRDRYGITQLYFSPLLNKELYDASKGLGREFVIAVDGTVNERESKNPQLPTGDIEIIVTELRILNTSKTPPFTIEDNTDGGDDLRMRYRYLDLRRNPVQQNLFFRSQVALETRKYLAAQGFIEVETPVLIKSTPEGARDFVVPSRLNPGQFYALPQSPQTFKQLLMVSGFDRYFQIVKCFRDEDLRADRQPEFTQIDCEMAFVHQEDILQMFEGLSRELFRNCIGVELPEFPRMKYDEAMERYGSDKPDLRFDMQIHDLTNLTKGKGFPVFDNAEYIGAINVSGAAGYTRKQIDEITEWVKRPQIGASGLVWAKYEEDGNCKSSVDKFYSPDDIKSWLMTLGAKPGDMLLLLCGEWEKTHKQLGDLRLHMADQLGIRQTGEFKPLWVVDFPLLEWDEESGRFFAMHHPFTSPKKEFIEDMKSNDKVKLANLRADAYDMVINGVEIGGGSIRIHDHDLQSLNFDLLGFTKEEAEAQFGFLLGAFEYGAPPHGGLAFGFDRLCAVMQGTNTIRDFIAFPKNNQGRDVMLDAPSPIKDEQLKELYLNVIPNS